MTSGLRRTLTHPALSLILRVYLAGIFIYASLHKINFPAEFADNIAGYLIVPYWLVNPLAVFMPWLELICGLFLLAGVRVRAAVLLIEGGLAAALTVWLGQRAGPRRGARGLEPRPDTPLAETFRKLP